MPIVTVEIVAGANDAMPSNIAQSFADVIGRALRSPPRQTWIRVRSIARDHHAENEASLDAAQLPVFVTILRRKFPRPENLEGEIAALTGAIAQVIGRPPASVHIEFAPAAAGRIAFGGVLVVE